MTVVDAQQIIESQDRATWRRIVAEPLWLAGAFLIAAIVLSWWTSSDSHAAQESASRSLQNATRARQATEQLSLLVPPHLPSDSAQRISALIDQTLRAASVSDRSLRSQSIRSLGSLGQTDVSCQQARLELSDVSLKQAGSIVNAFEHAELPVWVESTDLTPESNNQWTLVLELNWLQPTAK